MARLTRTLAFVLALAVPLAAQAETVFKIATVAPRGSKWMRVFNKMKAKIAKETGGAVKFRFYPGQVQGDERDVVRKMRTGQLQGGAFTAIGLALINPKLLVMQMPMMFKSYAQVDKIRAALKPELDKTFTDKGYVLLGWGEVGWIHLFSNEVISGIDHLKRKRVWTWNDDPISKAMWRSVGIKPRLLGLPQVYPALNTGMVDTVYNSHLGCMALQWHTKVKTMSAQPVALGTGATVVTKAQWDKLSPEHQATVLKITHRYHKALIKHIRRDNKRARLALIKAGVKEVPISASDLAVFKRSAKKVADSFAPRYYPKALLNKVRSLR